MSIKELVDLAYSKSPEFAFKVDWYRKRKTPRKEFDLFWITKHLEEVLGRDFVKQAAEEEIAKHEVSSGQTEQIQT